MQKISFPSLFLSLEEDISLKEAVDNQEPAKKETKVGLGWRI